jgi:PhnB protein
MKEVTTYLTFDGNCREAMTFYENCFGAELQLTSFSQMHGDLPKEAADRIMHARLIKGSRVLMASDTMPGMPFQPGNNFSVAIECESLPEIEKLFTALSEKGNVEMALQDAPWGARFGILTDRYGTRWMFNFELPKP